ncbi:MAG: hypothetical protein WEE89_18120 [Gemmatimonadota bacterium]
MFEVGLDGGLNGEAPYKNRRLNASFEARRVTEAWKFNFEFVYEYEDDRVTEQEFDDQGNVISHLLRGGAGGRVQPVSVFPIDPARADPSLCCRLRAQSVR